MGLGARSPLPGQQVEPRSRRAEDEHDRSDLEPAHEEHGSKHSLGKEQGGPPGNRPGREELGGGARRGIKQSSRNQGIGASGPRQRGEPSGIGSQAAADEPVAEPLPAPRLPALDRADRPSQTPRRLLVAEPLEIAQDQGRPVPLGEPLDLLVEHPAQLIARLGVPFRRLRRGQRGAPFTPAAACSGRPGACGGAEGHLVQPGAQRIAHPETAGLLDQHQEGRLKGVLRVVRVGQHAPADSQDHRSMPLEQRGEGEVGSLASAGRKPLQKLPVGQLPDRAHVEERAQLPDDNSVPSDRHGRDSPRTRRLPRISVMYAQEPPVPVF
jgi:hypothetical protein